MMMVMTMMTTMVAVVVVVVNRKPTRTMRVSVTVLKKKEDRRDG